MREFKLTIMLRGRDNTKQEVKTTLAYDVPYGWDSLARIKQEDWLYEKITDRLDITDFEEVEDDVLV